MKKEKLTIDLDNQLRVQAEKKKKTEKMAMGEFSDITLESMEKVVNLINSGLALPEYGEDESTGQETMTVKDVAQKRIVFFTDLDWQIKYIKKRLLQ